MSPGGGAVRALGAASALAVALAWFPVPDGRGVSSPTPELAAAPLAFEAAAAPGARPGLAGEPGGDDAEGADEASARVEALRRELEAILPARRWPGSRWGVLVTSIDRGDTLFSYNAHETLAPASNAKLLTSAAALHHLGPDFRYRTFLISDAEISDEGALRGDLVLYGTGDPALSNRFPGSGARAFRTMARRLRQLGIRTVDGDVVGDGTYFTGERRPEGWTWRDLNEWFAAPVSGLSYNENITHLHITPGSKPGAPLRVETIPENAPVPMRITGRTVAADPGHPVWAVREDPDQTVEVLGELRVDHPGIWRRLTVTNPDLYAAVRLRQILEEEGIRIRGRARAVDAPEGSAVTGRRVWAPGLSTAERPPRVLAEHRSPPLIELLSVVNKKSHNLYAEAALRTVGRVVAGATSYEGALAVLRRYLVEVVGVPVTEVAPADGSGLARTNRVSPYAFVRLVDHMARSPHWEAFWSTLPEAGDYRQLSRMYRSQAAGNLRAKTGTIEGVSALTGMVRSGDGERLAFSILSNDVPSTSVAKRVEDRVGMRLASFWRPGAEGPAVPGPGAGGRDR